MLIKDSFRPVNNLITITAAPAFDPEGRRLPGRFDAAVDGEIIASARRQPLLDGAKALQAEGADPQPTIILKHSEIECLRARLGTAAKLSVADRDRGRPFERWRPMPLSSAVEAQNAPERQNGLSHGTVAAHTPAEIAGIRRRAA
jgi:hypothetical protein